MSIAVETNPAGGSVRSRSITPASLNGFSTGAAAALPGDDEISMHMYGTSGDEAVEEIIIMPNVSKSEPKTKKKSGIFVMKSAQIKSNTVLNGDVKHSATNKSKTVTSTSSKSTPSRGGTSTKTMVSSGSEKKVERKSSVTKQKSPGSKVKKAGSFQMKSAHSGVSMPDDRTKTIENTDFKENLQRTLEKKTASKSALPNGEISQGSTIPRNSKSNVTKNIDVTVLNGVIANRKHTAESEIATSGGGGKYSEIRQPLYKLSSEKRESSNDHDSVVKLENQSAESAGENKLEVQTKSEQILQSKESVSEDTKSSNKQKITGATSSSINEHKTQGGGITKLENHTNSVTRPLKEQIPESSQAKRTHSEITNSEGNNKYHRTKHDNSLSVSAGVTSRYALGDEKERFSAQSKESRARGDVGDQINHQSGQNITYISKTTLNNSDKGVIRNSNVSEWSYHTEQGSASRPNSLLLNSEEYKSELGKQLASNLPVNSDRTEERKALFSPGRVQAQAVQFEDKNQALSPVSPAALEAQGLVKSGIVGKLAVELKDIPLTGRSLDAATPEKKKKAAANQQSTSTGNTQQKKQPKFLVEGIDYPAPEKTESTVPESVNNKSVSEADSSSIEVSKSTLERTEKKGFAYLKDKNLTSEVLKKAEQVTANKPHEAIEVRTLDNQQRAKSPEEPRLKEARSQLHHIEKTESSQVSNKNSSDPKQFALKSSLLTEIHSKVNKKEVTSSGQGNNTRVGEPDITEDSKVLVNGNSATKEAEEPVYQRYLPTPEIKKEVKQVTEEIQTNQQVRNISEVSTKARDNSLTRDTPELDTKSSTIIKECKSVDQSAIRSDPSDGVVRVSTKVLEPKYQNEQSERKYQNEQSESLEKGTARIYVISNAANKSDKHKKGDNNVVVNNPNSANYEFDLSAANLIDDTDMVVQHSKVQQGHGPPGHFKAERRVKSSYSTKASGEPEKKMESETAESYEWRGDSRGQANRSYATQQNTPAVEYSTSSRQEALRKEGKAPQSIPMRTVEVDINNTGVASANVKQMQSVFETQNIASSYSQNNDFVSGPNATSSMQRKVGDGDMNFQKVPIIRTEFERRAFEDISNSSQAKPIEPAGTFQNVQSMKTNYEYQSTNPQRGVPESAPTKNMRLTTYEQRNVNSGQHISRPKKRRKRHVTSVSVDGYQSEGGYASSSDAGSLMHARRSVSPYPRSMTPTVAGQTVVSGGTMTRNINASSTGDRVITPHLTEAKEENGQYHIKLDLNTNIQQALKNSITQASESRTREEMMQNQQYITNQQYATTGSTGLAGQTIEGSTWRSNGVNNNTLTTGYNTSRGPTPTHGADFLMNVNQTMTLDYVPRGNTPVPKGKSVSNIHLENEHRRVVQSDDHYAVKSLTRTEHIPQEPVDNQGRYVETLQVVDQQEKSPINVVRNNFLIKNSIDTTSAPKHLDVVEDTDSGGDVNVEDNTNMFHGKYFQIKENPMYSSDPDLRNPDLYRDEVDNRRVTKVRTERVRSVHDVPREEVVDYNSNIKYRRVPQKQHETSTSSWTYHQDRQPSLSSNNDDSMYEEGFNEEWEETRKQTYYKPVQGGRSSRTKKTSVSEYDFNRLLRDAPAESVKQSINVEREEEEIIGPLPMSHADGSSSQTDGMLNFDAISEKVDLGMKDGQAQLAVKVRCERVVPVYGQEEVYKKSSVIVTRLIEIDMEVSEERRRLYDNIMAGGSKQGMIEYGPGGSRYISGRSRKLTSKETFNLYKTFMGMAEEAEGMQGEQVHIEKQVEDHANRPELDSDLEIRRLSARKVKSPDSDTISYMSATEQPDILY